MTHLMAPSAHCPNRCRHSRLHARLLAAGLMALGATAGSAHAAEVLVKLEGLDDSRGRIACLLFAQPEGFPMQMERARVQWLDASAAGGGCRFDGVPAGTYAVGVLHDRNANGRIDTGFKGIPTEPWGISRNARPLLREPRFDEAAFAVAAGAGATHLVIQVR